MTIWIHSAKILWCYFKPFILAHPHPQYNRYIEPKNFKKFTIEHGNVVWGKNWDMIFPIEQLHRGIVA